MNQNIRYSFVVPVYNVESYIAQCLDSILGQEYQNFEIIIADDCSKDGSSAIYNKYKRRYPEKIKIIRNKKNTGPYYTRFNAIMQAKGDYIICVDSDDYIDNDLLTNLNTVIDNSHPDIIIYDYSSVYMLRGFGNINRSTFAYENDKCFDDGKVELYRRLVVGDISQIWRKCFRRDLLHKEDYCTDFSKVNLGEDVIFSIFILDRASKIEYLHNALYYYRRNVNSLTRSSKMDENINCFFYTRRMLAEYLNKWGAFSKHDFTKLCNDFVSMTIVDMECMRNIDSEYRNRIYLQLKKGIETFINEGYLGKEVAIVNHQYSQLRNKLSSRIRRQKRHNLLMTILFR